MPDQYLAQPQWIEVKPVRSPTQGVEPSLSDVDSHQPAGHPYKDSRHITWCHETTHGVNAAIRNQRVQMIDLWLPGKVGVDPPQEHDISYRLPVPAGYVDEKVFAGSVNGFYVLNNRGVRLNEPHFKLSDVAKAVPSVLQGMSYQTYLIQQQKYWQDSPLYVLDEWSAYLNGLTCGLEANLREASYSDLLQPLEFMGYAWSLWNLVVSAAGAASAWDLRDFIAYQTARTMMLYKMCQRSNIFNNQHSGYFANFRLTYDAMIKTWCGLSWTKKVFEDQDFNGIF